MEKLFERVERSRRLPYIAIGLSALLLVTEAIPALDDMERLIHGGDFRKSVTHALLLGLGATLIYRKWKERQDAAQALEREKEEEGLARGLTATALGGTVRHLRDIEFTLAIIRAGARPSDASAETVANSKRTFTDALEEFGPKAYIKHYVGPILDSRAPNLDPRTREAPPSDSDRSYDGWTPIDVSKNEGAALIDKCVLRLVAMMRDWAALATGSEHGVKLWLTHGEIRRRLMVLKASLGPSPMVPTEDVISEITTLQREVRILAAYHDRKSFTDQRNEDLPERHDVLHRCWSGVGRPDDQGLSEGLRRILMPEQLRDINVLTADWKDVCQCN